MDDETRRLMTGAAERARSCPGFIGHAIAQWERRSGMSGRDILGGSADSITRLEMTPLPQGENRRARLRALAEELRVDPTALMHLTE